MELALTTKQHGFKIQTIYFPPSQQEDGFSITANEKLTLKLSATHHGDRDEFWVIQTDINADGKEEIKTHNCKYIETIEWAKQ